MRNFLFKIFACLIAFVFASCFPVYAEEYNEEYAEENNYYNREETNYNSRAASTDGYARYYNKKFFISASYGLATKKASYELIYVNEIVSRLDWLTNNASILSFDIGWKPINRLTLQFRTDFNILERSGTKNTMDDYDWMNGYENGITHWSHHTELALKYMMFDASIKYDALIFGNYKDYGEFIIGVMLGFKSSFTQWLSFAGGHYEYPEEWGGVVDDPYDFDKGNALKFTTKMYLPYYGLYAGYKYKRFNALFAFRNSLINVVSPEDKHQYQGLAYKGGVADIKDMMYYDITLNAGFLVNEHIRLFGEFMYMETKYQRSSIKEFSLIEDGEKIENDSEARLSYKDNAYVMRFGASLAF